MTNETNRNESDLARLRRIQTGGEPRPGDLMWLSEHREFAQANTVVTTTSLADHMTPEQLAWWASKND